MTDPIFWLFAGTIALCLGAVCFTCLWVMGLAGLELDKCRVLRQQLCRHTWVDTGTTFLGFLTLYPRERCTRCGKERMGQEHVVK